jgi:hypothetical protein
MLTLTLLLLIGAWNNIALALFYWIVVIGVPIGASLFILRALFRTQSKRS